MKTLAEKIAVMQAAERGEQIECKATSGGWQVAEDPSWNWFTLDYRVAPRTMTIWVCAWKNTPDRHFVSEMDPAHRHDRDNLTVLSKQDIIY